MVIVILAEKFISYKSSNDKLIEHKLYISYPDAVSSISSAHLICVMYCDTSSGSSQNTEYDVVEEV